jgi:hypothetical protein
MNVGVVMRRLGFWSIAAVARRFDNIASQERVRPMRWRR